MSCQLEQSQVEEGSNTLLKMIENDRTTKNRKLLSSAAAPVFLQIDFVKIPKIQKRIARIPLKNSLLMESSDVCLIVADLIRGRKVNHEVTLNHYQKLLTKKKVFDVQKLHVMSSRQIRVDYSTYEAKRKLCKMFDVFLIDEKISDYLRPKLGKEFPKARKWPIPIRIKRKDLKEEIISKLKKTSLALDGTGTTKTVQVGHVDMSSAEIAENIMCVANYICEKFPGGWDNIRTLYLKGLRSAALPIYMSLLSKNDVPTPKFDVKRRNKILASEEVSIVGREVTVYKSGHVKIKKRKIEEASKDGKTDEESPNTKKPKIENEKHFKKLKNEKIKKKNKVTDVSENKKINNDDNLEEIGSIKIGKNNDEESSPQINLVKLKKKNNTNVRNESRKIKNENSFDNPKLSADELSIKTRDDCLKVPMKMVQKKKKKATEVHEEIILKSKKGKKLEKTRNSGSAKSPSIKKKSVHVEMKPKNLDGSKKKVKKLSKMKEDTKNLICDLLAENRSIKKEKNSKKAIVEKEAKSVKKTKTLLGSVSSSIIEKKKCTKVSRV